MGPFRVAAALLTFCYSLVLGAQYYSCCSVTEGGTCSISCSGTDIIASIYSANYGTNSGSTCGSYSKESCQESTSSSIVSTACLYKSSCSVSASNSVFGDPCYGTLKSLYIQVVCANPTANPTLAPTAAPTVAPSFTPSGKPSISPTAMPSTMLPTKVPTVIPTVKPTFRPSVIPTSMPRYTIIVYNFISLIPNFNLSSVVPSVIPSTTPTAVPTELPTDMPTEAPTYSPSLSPSHAPSTYPTYNSTTRVYFIVTQVLDGISKSEYSKNRDSNDNALKQTVSAAVGFDLPPSDVYVDAVNDYSLFLRHRSLANTSASMQLIYAVNANTKVFADISIATVSFISKLNESIITGTNPHLHNCFFSDSSHYRFL